MDTFFAPVVFVTMGHVLILGNRTVVYLEVRYMYLRKESEVNINAKSIFMKFKKLLSESSRNFLSDRLGKFLSYRIFQHQNNKTRILRRFYHISLIKSLISGLISYFALCGPVPPLPEARCYFRCSRFSVN